VQQLYTGFSMLAENGLIDISQEIRQYSTNSTSKKQYLKNATDAHLVVELLSGKKQKMFLYFDNHDSQEIDENHLQDCDIYFKRSFSQNYINDKHFEYKDKIHPLGLNYWVLPNKCSMMTLYRNLSLSKSTLRKLDGIISSIDTRNKIRFYPRLRNLHSLPVNFLEPKVLFMVTAYDPYDDPKRPKEKIEERIYNNEFRANCVRALRNELGLNFFGGFVHSKYTIENYKDVLLDDPKKCRKQNYLKILNTFPICIATTGLHGSIGWKFAEYVAFSKAIVSEKLHYSVPGFFQPEHNYLEFSSPENCVEQSIKLLSNQQLRTKLMFNNSIYYQHYVKPDMLVLNAISIAMNKLNENALGG
jgi:hypothetical protein